MKTFAFTTLAMLGFVFYSDQTATAGGHYHNSWGQYGTNYGNPWYSGGWGHQHRRGHYDYHDTTHYDYVPDRVVPHGNHWHHVPGGYYLHQTGHYDYHRGGHHH
ncbi:hypothetical protein SH661x_004700 [Planctomicrobium sp. SH661]|uniref:hypothetical protein n=1 Tax=Planctomicrobium sp. SH661 TaxID=3448124 RepID=UPI003F5BD3F2